ncbi:hypothetical protein JKP88DRAFT_280744 [Tribonema minus]|uniref:Uncharacterized protein n=1 Tax=Tribonema minus TaxID=303371 RepID=A0A835YP77_9STRA|nr:hypothetical protein JKP88DRAFT_280744 [Tribonema minus]
MRRAAANKKQIVAALSRSLALEIAKRINSDGHTAEVGEKEKEDHHDGALSSSWVFVPFVQESAAANKKQIVAALNRSLAQELAERVIAYVRGATMLGCAARPVSQLLSHGSV